MSDTKSNQEKLEKQWKDLSSSAPEVAPLSDKQTIDEDEKQVVLGKAPEVVEEKNLPQAIDDEGDKEVVSTDSSTSVSSDEKIPVIKDAISSPIRKRKKLLIAAIALVVVLAVALGVGLGIGLKKKSNKAPPTYYDAQGVGSIATPPTTGSYNLSLGTPQAANSSCLTNENQKSAWSCNLVPSPQFNITVGALQGSRIGAQLQSTTNDTSNLTYGAQISDMSVRVSQFLSVKDMDNPELGPAWYFQDLYNKTVLVPESSLSNTSSGSGPSGEGPSSGDKPWLCLFNSTAVEGFLYVDQKQNQTENSNAESPEEYPLLVKIEERRDAKYGATGYCQQYEVLDDGGLNWVSDSNGNPVTLELDESESAGDGCHCQWMSDSS